MCPDPLKKDRINPFTSLTRIRPHQGYTNWLRSILWIVYEIIVIFIQKWSQPDNIIMYPFSYSYESVHAYEYNNVLFSLTVISLYNGFCISVPDNYCQHPFRFEVKTTSLKHFHVVNRHSVSLLNSGFHIFYEPHASFHARFFHLPLLHPPLGVTDSGFIKKRWIQSYFWSACKVFS